LIGGQCPPYVIQRRIAGTPAAAVFVAADGAATFLGATRQLIGEPWLGAHGFQYAGSIGPLPISDAALVTVKKVGHTLAERFELLGLFGVDFILNGDDVWTLEVNPRYTASVEIVERIIGVQAIAAHAAACTGSPIPHSRLPTSHSASASQAKATLFARHDLAITPEFAEWSVAESERTPWPNLADISPAGTPIAAGRPILTLFAEAATPEAVEQQLRQRVAELEVRLYAASSLQQ
jgi:predicted ATP-grasp superfamily ATP-dependent carboligase